MTRPLISVVMPVYNREQYLKESIESILNQTFTDFEFIIVDDQSTDSSWQIIQEYADKDSRIAAVKNNEIKGCWAARNFGWDLAQGKYMAIMDSDDIALPERLQKEFDFMEQHPEIDICGSWMEKFGADCGKTTSYPLSHDEIRDTMFFEDSIPQPTIFMKLASFEKFHLKYTNNVAEDYDLWCRAIDNLKFANIPEVLMLYRVHENQTGIANKKEQDNGANYIRIRNLKNIGITLSEKEVQIYLDIIQGKVAQKNKKDLISAIKTLDKISIAGTKYGYQQLFQDKIRIFIKNIAEHSLQKKITSLKLYVTTFRKWKILVTPRANLRYIYHCLRNSFHV
ncbi:glycosyltransferase [bacterium]|nr:glycosyltransferase [bacterium]